MTAKSDLVLPRVVVNAIICKDGKLLFCLKKGKLIFPGGKKEKGESNLICLGREMREELGVYDVDFCQPIQFYSHYNLFSISGNPIVVIATLLQISGDPKASSEIDSIEWVKADDALCDSRISSATKVVLEFFTNRFFL